MDPREAWEEYYRWPEYGFDPQPGLPRRYLFCRDPAFYVFLVLLALYAWNTLAFWHVLFVEGGEWWLKALIGVLLLLHPAFVWSVIWDSYRWDIPSRWIYIVIAALFSILFLPIYLLFRQEWVMQAKRVARGVPPSPRFIRRRGKPPAGGP